MNNNSVRIEAGDTIHYKVMVKFDQYQPVPFVQTIHFNGRRICPPDLPRKPMLAFEYLLRVLNFASKFCLTDAIFAVTLSVGEGVTNPRPDLEFPDPFIDTVPDIQVPKPTRYGTYSSTTEIDRNM